MRTVIHNYIPQARTRDEDLPPGITRNKTTGEFMAGGMNATRHEGHSWFQDEKHREAMEESKKHKPGSENHNNWTTKANHHHQASQAHAETAKQLRASNPQAASAAYSKAQGHSAEARKAGRKVIGRAKQAGMSSSRYQNSMV